jgi:hypothetical protein
VCQLTRACPNVGYNPDFTSWVNPPNTWEITGDAGWNGSWISDVGTSCTTGTVDRWRDFSRAGFNHISFSTDGGVNWTKFTLVVHDSRDSKSTTASRIWWDKNPELNFQDISGSIVFRGGKLKATINKAA